MTDTPYVEAIPQNGDVRHAILRNAVIEGRRFAVGNALCGVRGRDAWGGGGMAAEKDDEGNLIPFTATDPNPNSKTGWDGSTINEWCPRCIRKIKGMSS